jgi:hypothetical protein
VGIVRVAVVAVGFVLVAALGASSAGGSHSSTASVSTAADPTPPSGLSLVCKLPPRARKLPATRRHGLVQHLLQYPVVRLATLRQRARARRLLAQLVATAQRERWRGLSSAERAGYDTRTAPRKPGDRSVHYFHAERSQEPRRRVILDPSRPKALIYANAPGRPLVLVGAMWSTRDGELGPTPAGPILRWHSHVVCKQGDRRGLKPPASGKCPPGSRLTQGASEMLHVWFTPDLRSAFAIRAPEPELCAAGLLPRARCR